jgi:hypothetical protein
MDEDIWTEAAQFLFWEYINPNFFAVRLPSSFITFLTSIGDFSYCLLSPDAAFPDGPIQLAMVIELISCELLANQLLLQMF